MNDRQKRTTAVWGLVVLLWLPKAAVGVSGSEVVDRVQERLANFRTFSARFEKQFYWAVLDKHASQEGRIYLRRPNRFRLEVTDENLIVADGEAIWAYSKRNQQVIVSSYQGELRTPWEVLLEYTDSYEPLAVDEVELDGRACYLLVLKPQTAGSRVVQLKVWVDRRRWLLMRVEQLEIDDSVTTYILKDHRIDRRLDDQLFQFAPPEGVEVIDRRELLGRGN